MFSSVSLPLVSAQAFGQTPSGQCPNIVMIFVDDMGYGDVSCNWTNSLVPTPNIDRIAEGGVRFTDGYVSASVCAASRCGLLTGAYNERFGCYWNEDKPYYSLPEEQRLMPEPLRAAGYKTGLAGKWNIPARDPSLLFDEMYDVMDWEGDYFPGEDGEYVGVNSGHASSKVPYWGPKRPGDEYLTDRISRHAAEFITKYKDDPFFLYVAYNAPHSPLQAKEAYKPRVAHLKEEPLKLYGAMVISLDEGVGTILDTLAANGLEENTMVVFVSDNGPTIPFKIGYLDEWPRENILLGSVGPLSGHKGQFLEGGGRVPFLIKWPKKIQAGTTYTEMSSALDLYPTFCDIAGAERPAGTILDGVNLMPHLLGEKPEAPHDILFWMAHGQGGVREGKWKLIINREPWAPRLYDLSKCLIEDPAYDQAPGHPEVVERLMAAFKKWNRDFPPAADAVRKGEVQ